MSHHGDTMRPHASERSRRLVWAAGLVVALGAGVATAHGLFEVAVAAHVPRGIAWLYPLITDGLALVAYAATARLQHSGRRYAWLVVVLAAGLSGVAQASYLAGGVHTAPTGLRFGVGAWPAVAAAIVAHLLYLLGGHEPQQLSRTTAAAPTAVGPERSVPEQARSAAVFNGLTPPVVQSESPHAAGALNGAAYSDRPARPFSDPPTEPDRALNTHAEHPTAAPAHAGPYDGVAGPAASGAATDDATSVLTALSRLTPAEPSPVLNVALNGTGANTARAMPLNDRAQPRTEDPTAVQPNGRVGRLAVQSVQSEQSTEREGRRLSGPIERDGVPPVRPPAATSVQPAGDRARAAARSHHARHGRWPTVTDLMDQAQVARGTAGTVLKELRNQPPVPENGTDPRTTQ